MLLALVFTVGCREAGSGNGGDSGTTSDSGAGTPTCTVPAGIYVVNGLFTEDFLTNYNECSWTLEVGVAPPTSPAWTTTIEVADGTPCGPLEDVSVDIPLLNGPDCSLNGDGATRCLKDGTLWADGTEALIEGGGEMYWEFNDGQSGGSCSPEVTFSRETTFASRSVARTWKTSGGVGHR